MPPDLASLELEPFREPLLQLAQRLLRHWPGIEAEDRVQEVFTQLIERPPRQSIENLEGYLRRAVRNRVYDAIRQEICKACASLPLDKSDSITSPSGKDGRREIYEKLQAALEELSKCLSPAHRDAVELHHCFGCTQREIKEHLGLKTLGQVANLIRGGLDKLLKLLPAETDLCLPR